MSKPKQPINHAPGAVQVQASPEPTKEIVNRSTGEVTMLREQQESEVLRSDIIIPYLIIQQGMSDFVQNRKAQLGDICKSTDPTKLGDPENPIEVIFLHSPKAEWALEQKPPKSDKFKFRKSIERNAINETWQWSYWSDDDGLIELAPNQPGATEWRRVKRLSVFSLLVGDIIGEKIEKAKLESGDLPDPSKALTPVIISFRSMSYDAGKEIATFFTQAKSMGVNIWRYRVPMAAKFEQNDKGNFYVWAPDRTKAKAVDKDDLAIVSTWAQIVGSKQNYLQVDEDGEQTEEKAVF